MNESWFCEPQRAMKIGGPRYLLWIVPFRRDSSASSRSNPPSPRKDPLGCPTPSKNNPCTRAFSRSQTSAPNPREQLSLSRRPLPFPSRGKCCKRGRTWHRFPCRRTLLHTPQGYSQNPAKHAARGCPPFQSPSPGRKDLHSRDCHSPG